MNFDRIFSFVSCHTYPTDELSYHLAFSCKEMFEFLFLALLMFVLAYYFRLFLC